MINYHQLNKQIHPLSSKSKKITDYIKWQLSYHLTNKKGYIFIPTIKQYKKYNIFPLTYPGSKKKFKKLILEFFLEEYQPKQNK